MTLQPPTELQPEPQPFLYLHLLSGKMNDTAETFKNSVKLIDFVKAFRV